MGDEVTDECLAHPTFSPSSSGHHNKDERRRITNPNPYSLSLYPFTMQVELKNDGRCNTSREKASSSELPPCVNFIRCLCIPD